MSTNVIGDQNGRGNVLVVLCALIKHCTVGPDCACTCRTERSNFGTFSSSSDRYNVHKNKNM